MRQRVVVAVRFAVPAPESLEDAKRVGANTPSLPQGLPATLECDSINFGTGSRLVSTHSWRIVIYCSQRPPDGVENPQLVVWHGSKLAAVIEARGRCLLGRTVPASGRCGRLWLRARWRVASVPVDAHVVRSFALTLRSRENGDTCLFHQICQRRVA